MTDTSLLAIARGIAVEAAERVAEARRGIVEVADVKSSSVDVVTQVDRDTESFIRGRLLELRPDDAFLGEESGGGGGTSGLTWVVDPIDGTVNFLYGIPHYAVSIAVVEGEPDPQSWTALAGAVINPATGELFTGSAGGGAFLGEQPLRALPVASIGREHHRTRAQLATREALPGKDEGGWRHARCQVVDVRQHERVRVEDDGHVEVGESEHAQLGKGSSSPLGAPCRDDGGRHALGRQDGHAERRAEHRLRRGHTVAGCE